MIDDGGWQHVAMVKENDIISWYFNGVLLGTSSHTETYSGAAPELSAIGSRPIFGNWDYANQGLYSFQGLIDDVYLYGNALTATEVVSLSAVPLAAACLGSGVVWAGYRQRRNVGHAHMT